MKRIFLSIFCTVSLVAMDHKRKAPDQTSPPVSGPPTPTIIALAQPPFKCQVKTYRASQYCGQNFTQLKELKKHLLVSHSFTHKTLKEYCALHLLQG